MFFAKKVTSRWAVFTPDCNMGIKIKPQKGFKWVVSNNRQELCKQLNVTKILVFLDINTVSSN